MLNPKFDDIYMKLVVNITIRLYCAKKPNNLLGFLDF